MSLLRLNMSGKAECLDGCFGRAFVAAVVGSMFLVIGTQYAVGRTFPLAPIVGGHRLQPQENELRTLHTPDVTAPEAAEIDRLYQRLVGCPMSQCVTRNGNGQSQYP
jgi:ABC-type glucose/galactose transport system permease subunit